MLKIFDSESFDDFSCVKTGFTYDDVLLVPYLSKIFSRSNVDLTQDIFGKKLKTPIMPANMSSICEDEMVTAVCSLGGTAAMHRFMTINEYFEKYKKILKEPKCLGAIGITLGLNEEWNFELINKIYKLDKKKWPLYAIIDVAHGHHERVLNLILSLRQKYPYMFDADYGIKIIIGNICTKSAANYFLQDSNSFFNATISSKIHGLKVGVGGGCFVEGTLVGVKDGFMPIDLIVVGDQVLTHKNRYRKVIRTIVRRENKEIYKIGDILCTSNHKFFVVSKKWASVIGGDFFAHGEWVPANRLTDNFFLIKSIGGINKRYVLKDMPVIEKTDYNNLVYDIEVEEDHSYVVSRDSVCVHNSVCTTRQVTGCGFPQLSAVKSVSDVVYNSKRQDVIVIADGGIRSSGDIVKALGAGADLVMAGGIFAGVNETPKITYNSSKRYYAGMASSEENNRFFGKKFHAPEGVIKSLDNPVGCARDIYKKMDWGIKSGLSYCGCSNLVELREYCKNPDSWIRVTSFGFKEGTAHFNK